jgi:hypothetical protein
MLKIIASSHYTQIYINTLSCRKLWELKGNDFGLKSRQIENCQEAELEAGIKVQHLHAK